MAQIIPNVDEKERQVYDLERTAQLVLEKDLETIYVFRDKLWTLAVEVDTDYRVLMIISFPDEEDFDEHITELIIDDGYSVIGGLLRDQIIVDFND